MLVRRIVLIVVCALLLAVGGLVLRFRAQSTPSPADDAAAVSALAGNNGDVDVEAPQELAEFDQVEAEYLATRSELRAALDERTEELGPEVVEPVEENLGLIEKAVVELLAAISDNPDNPSLRKMLLDMYREETRLLRKALTFGDE